MRVIGPCRLNKNWLNEYFRMPCQDPVFELRDAHSVCQVGPLSSRALHVCLRGVQGQREAGRYNGASLVFLGVLKSMQGVCKQEKGDRGLGNMADYK